MDPSFKTQYFDGFAPEEDSDVDLNELDSSDEEKLDSSLNKYLSKLAEPSSKCARKRGSASHFEAEMEDELEEEMMQKERGQGSRSEAGPMKKVKFNDQVTVTSIEQPENEEDQPPALEAKVKDKEEEEEEDTDSEKEFETGERCTKKRVHMTNDELFYDPERDDKDQDWINARRKTCPVLKKAATTSSADSPTTSKAAESYEARFKEAQTDAILNCPCCLSLLCMDCQRHEKYRTQFRAMFVFNCKVAQDEVLKYPKDADQDKRRQKKNLSTITSDMKQIGFGDREFDEYKPVKCEKCETEVGVYEEKEELYHFFNVLTGH